eukprot:11086580-Alexandrium_andersonii.AAC.1
MERRRSWWVWAERLLSERRCRCAARIGWSRMGGVKIEAVVEWFFTRAPVLSLGVFQQLAGPGAGICGVRFFSDASVSGFSVGVPVHSM